jgi:hypothetical protein
MQQPFPCHMTIDDIEMAKWFLQEIQRLQRLPVTIVSDLGAQFFLSCWVKICSCLKIDQGMSTAFPHQMDGQMERINMVVHQYLRVFVNHNQNERVQ